MQKSVNRYFPSLQTGTQWHFIASIKFEQKEGTKVVVHEFFINDGV